MRELTSVGKKSSSSATEDKRAINVHSLANALQQGMRQKQKQIAMQEVNQSASRTRHEGQTTRKEGRKSTQRAHTMKQFVSEDRVINKKKRLGEQRELGENENWVSFCTYAFRRPGKEREKIARNNKQNRTKRFPPNAKRLDNFPLLEHLSALNEKFANQNTRPKGFAIEFQ
jgi:hypothetical protein